MPWADMNTHVIILAAGQGTRMQSSLPKVLHPLAGRPLLSHVIDTARQLNCQGIHVVYGHGGELVRQQITDRDINWVHQPEQHGTGHAVQLALQQIDDDGMAVVLYGDVPMIRASTIQLLLDQARQLAILSAVIDNPEGYGRILRDQQDRVIGIREHRDASDKERRIHEINTGIMAARISLLKGLLDKVGQDNDQGELYLTDTVEIAVRDEIPVDCVQADEQIEVSGINDKLQLAAMEREKQRQIANALMKQGVTLMDPARLDVRGELVCGRDVVIDVNVIIEGQVVLGDGVHIGPQVCLKDCNIESNTLVRANCVIESASIAEDAIIGPFARIRPGTVLHDSVHIGNFVEIKNAEIQTGSKVNHLSYIGDTDMGSGVNIGAGTITCNYDGANKHRTVIGDNAFIGSGTELVAPVTVGKGATIGAGSTITKDAPDDGLTLTRNQQKTISGWRRPTKKK